MIETPSPTPYFTEQEREYKIKQLVEQGWIAGPGYSYHHYHEMMDEHFVVSERLGINHIYCSFYRKLEITENMWIGLPKGTTCKPNWVTGLYRVAGAGRENDEECEGRIIYGTRSGDHPEDWSKLTKVQLLRPCV